MRRLRHLTGQHRTASTNRLLGALLFLSLPPLLQHWRCRSKVVPLFR